MKLQTNKFKQRFKARDKTQYGLWLGLTDQIAAEIAAGAGFDWLLIDEEHAPFNVRTVLTHLQVLAAYDVAPIVRPVNHDKAHLKKLLDIGAQNFLIPMVNTVEDIDQLEQALMYPPRGVRGLGTALARAAKWNRITDYAMRANDEICLIVQVETVTALENLEGLLAHKAVDGAFIGPLDLGASMGYPGQATHPEVVAATNDAIKKIVASGKVAGVLATAPEFIQSCKDSGASFIGVGADTVLLAKATQSLAATYIESASDGSKQAGY